jgi:glycine cleavage system aminomethyltransferase T/glycine/D-amino acid oxidase-like deaminating enzyme
MLLVSTNSFMPLIQFEMAVGLMVTYGSMSETSTELRKYTKQLYSTVLEQETGQSTGFLPCGFIELATNPDRLEEFRRVATFNRRCGVDVQEISPHEVQRLFPLCRVDDILAGFYVKDDGRVNPVDATMAFVKGARKFGAKVVEGVSVTGVRTEPNGKIGGKRVTGVETKQGFISATTVVNCSGMWARQLSDSLGVLCPNQAAEHYYLLTGEMPEVSPAWPVIEDPSSYTYIRPEGGGLMVGLFEPHAAAWNVNQIPGNFSFGDIAPDWDRMAPFLEKAMARVPACNNVELKKFFCGPESFTPDLAPIVGQTPEVDNLFIAAGLNSIGILTGGGIGRLLAHWVLHGKPDMDVTGMNVDRLRHYQNTPAFRSQRVVESLGKVYKCHYPNTPNTTCRGAKQSPIYDRLKARGAYFRDVSGWESADFFSPDQRSPAPRVGEIPLTWGRPQWWAQVAREHKACREGVIVLDMSFMSKFRVRGRDAGKCLNFLATANVDGEVGVITYTQFLNDDGCMEADLTVTKLADDDFLVIATDGAHRHVEAHMQRHFPADAHVFVCDVTSGYAQINVQGPKSRSLMQALTQTDMSNAAFPFRAVKRIDIGFANVICARITYLGELGYELFVPTEQAVHLYDCIVAEGEKPEHGLVHAGLKALASLRMEKAYRDFGHDLDNTDKHLETGLSFTCDFDKKGGFLGKEAVLAHRLQATLGKGSGALTGLYQRIVQIKVLDPEPLMYHGEVVFRDGVMVGDVRAAAYGHTLQGAVGLAHISPRPDAQGKRPYITQKYLTEGVWEVEINNTRYPIALSLKPMYDPNNEKIKA